MPLTAGTLRRLSLVFDAAVLSEATALLEGCGRDLPFMQDATEEGLERIRLAVLKLSGGDLARLRDAIALARTDWRDVLVAAGFDQLNAHLRWLPGDDLVRWD